MMEKFHSLTAMSVLSAHGVAFQDFNRGVLTYEFFKDRQVPCYKVYVGLKLILRRKYYA